MYGDIVDGAVLMFKLFVLFVVIVVVSLISFIFYYKGKSEEGKKERKKEIKDSNYKNSFMIFILAMIIVPFIGALISIGKAYSEYSASAKQFGLDDKWDAYIMVFIEYTMLIIAASLIYYLLD